MAIDTAAKRRAVVGIAFVAGGTGITPDSNKDAFWRAVSGYSYNPALSPGGGAGLEVNVKFVGMMSNVSRGMGL